MAEPDFIQRQYEFAAYLRDPDNNPAPSDVETRRMHIYRDLFFNNVRSMLAGNFPVLAEVLGEDRWALLVRDFYRDHQSRSPLFPELPREFLHYLAEERAQGKRSDSEPDLPFTYELAHYEWVESGLMLADDEPQPHDLRESGNLMDEQPVVSKLAWLLRYEFAVNEIGPDAIPTEPCEQPRFYLVYRDSDYEIHFVQLNAVTARLLELLQTEEQLTGTEALTRIADEMQHPNPDKVIAGGSAILDQWKQLGVVLGTRLPG